MKSETGVRNNDLRNQPAYPVAEAAHYLRLPPATLRSWVAGRSYPKGQGQGHFQPLIKPAQGKPPVLSFWNLIEAHVLRSLRTEHGLPVRELRKAIRYAEKEMSIDHLLLRKDLCTHAGQVFLDQYGKLISLNASGQLALRMVFEEYLRRVEWDEWQFPVRLYPFLPGESRTQRSIAIDPAIAFGRPVVLSKGVSTGAIAERIDAGEAVTDLADDYGMTPEEIEQAVLYERAA